MPSVAMHMHLPSADHTEALGAALARALPDAAALGAVIYLHGDLGAGKTTCVRSLLRAVGVTRPVRSPTYTLVETYATQGLECIHVDLYRLNGALDAEALGLRDMAGPASLLLIEWPEKGGAGIPRPDLELHIEYAQEGRQGRFSSRTSFGERWLSNLGDDTRLISYVSNIT